MNREILPGDVAARRVDRGDRCSIVECGRAQTLSRSVSFPSHWSSAIKRQVEGGEGLYRGREELGAFWDEWHAVWSHLTIVVSEISSPRDGCVFAFGALRGSGKGSGVDTERPFGWVFQLEEG